LQPGRKKLQALWLRFLSEINEDTRVVDPELLEIPEIREAIELSSNNSRGQCRTFTEVGKARVRIFGD
jgi:hypothetical protein